MVEFADQLHRPFECMNAAVAMVADVHHPPTGRTSTVEEVEFPKSEIGISKATCKAILPPSMSRYNLSIAKAR